MQDGDLVYQNILVKTLGTLLILDGSLVCLKVSDGPVGGTGRGRWSSGWDWQGQMAQWVGLAGADGPVGGTGRS